MNICIYIYIYFLKTLSALIWIQFEFLYIVRQTFFYFFIFDETNIFFFDMRLKQFKIFEDESLLYNIYREYYLINKICC